MKENANFGFCSVLGVQNIFFPDLNNVREGEPQACESSVYDEEIVRNVDTRAIFLQNSILSIPKMKMKGKSKLKTIEEIQLELESQIQVESEFIICCMHITYTGGTVSAKKTT